MPPEEATKQWAEVREAAKKFGAKGYWRKQIEIYERNQVSQPSVVPPLSIVASFYAQLGENDQAFAFLEKSYEKREIDVIRLKSPIFDPIRSDPRFQDLMHRIGLPQ
ncbi:MAG: hypothetical protein LC768_04480 [Acidobacteria bacterium]|nr:hypothetical protein [Acidobacteriota bacterium]